MIVKTKDLVGQKFGKLTVVEKVGDYVNPKGTRIPKWKCVCNCKTENPNCVVVIGGNLKGGSTTSCGCARVDSHVGYKHAIEDLTGQKFGRLTVINQAEPHIDSFGNRFTQWRCVCDCNIDNPNYVIVRAAHLKNGNTKSCGCYKKEQMFKASKKYNMYDLTGGYGIGFTFKDEPFFFDLEDYNKIKECCWRYDKYGYVITSVITGKSNTNVFFHRIIMEPCIEETIDHIYHICHDNRKSQLRIVTTSQNMMNREKSINNNIKGIKGVQFTGKSKPWLAKIMTNGKIVRKSFYSREDAVAYRLMLEKMYHGEYALKPEQLNNDIEEVII